MRILVLSETFSRKTGYISNMLPRFLARMGDEVHLGTMDLPPYYQLVDFDQTYGSFSRDEGLVPGTTETHDGYQLHVMGHQRRLGYMFPAGLRALIERVRPDVVQAPSAIGWLPMIAAAAKAAGADFGLFTASHTTRSTFPLAQRHAGPLSPARLRCLAMRATPGRIVSLLTERCYCPTRDSAEIAWRYFGVERDKVVVMPLGVDTDVFHPVSSQADVAERAALRRELGLGDDEIVCVYSGKLTATKNALLLAQAVARLRQAGHRHRALVIGDGVQREEIAHTDGTVLVGFVHYAELARYYRAADVGVWPTNESTSTLDAAASGLPLVVTNAVADCSHVTGNGIVIRQGDPKELDAALLRLADPATRAAFGVAGSVKMARDYSWASVARRRRADYAAWLKARPRRTTGRQPERTVEHDGSTD